MEVKISKEEFENLLNDIVLNLDTIIFLGQGLSKEDVPLEKLSSHSSFIRIHNCANFVFGIYKTLRRLGLRFYVGELQAKIRQLLRLQYPHYESQVHIIASETIKDFIR